MVYIILLVYGVPVERAPRETKKAADPKNIVNIVRMTCRFHHSFKHLPPIMKSEQSGASPSIKKISKKDHALLKKMYKKSTPNGFNRPRAETDNVLKYADGGNAAAFFDNFKYVQAKETDSDSKGTTRS